MDFKNGLEFKYSFGYDCLRNYNLCSCDKDSLAWASGSYISFFNITFNQMSFKRSFTGGTIGHIIKNPMETISHIAVGESGLDGIDPQIVIYEWPSMIVVAKLAKGTSKQYVNIDYSPDGNLLASVGDSPDYFLTIWDWKNCQIKLQAHAFHDPVFNVQFSPNDYNQLITSGTNHIKFWEITETFTGTKLLGKLGKFGKISVSDIFGVLHMPKDIILSGCSWGNILVWESGQIKYEVSRKGNESCHGAPITQIVKLSNTEIITVGLDGKICTWYWEALNRLISIENSEIVLIELNPVAEISVPEAKFMNICHKENNEWFAQDAAGCIWNIKLDENLNIGVEADELKKTKPIFYSHGGKIIGLTIINNNMFTLGEDGTMFFIKMPTGPLVYQYKFTQSTSALLYLSYSTQEPNLKLIVVGFESGMIKLICLDLQHLEDLDPYLASDKICVVIQKCKPHTKKVTSLNWNMDDSLLMTASEDSTMFLYKIRTNYFDSDDHVLTPLYFLETPEIISSITWKPNFKNIVLLSGYNGLIMEAELPVIDCNLTIETELTTYKKTYKSSNQWRIPNYKLQFMNNNATITRHNLSELELVSFADTFDRHIVWAFYKHNTENCIIFAQENCNCVFFMNTESSAVTQYIPLDGPTDMSLTKYLYLPTKKISIIGTNSGDVNIISYSNKIYDNNISDNDQRKFKKNLPKPVKMTKVVLSDIVKIPIHDNVTGAITDIVLSPESKYFVTAGEDGNIFCFENTNTLGVEIAPIENKINLQKILSLRISPEESISLSHEEKVQEKERARLLGLELDKKSFIENELSQLKAEFNSFMEENETMPLHLQVATEWEPRILNHVNETLEKEKSIIYNEMAFPLSMSNMRLEKLMERNVNNLEMFPFQVNSVMNPKKKVFIIRQNKLSDEFFNDFDKLKTAIKQMDNIAMKDGIFSLPRVSTESFESDQSLNVSKADSEKENEILKNLPSSHHLPQFFTKILKEYLKRIERNQRQKHEWEEHLKKQLVRSESSEDHEFIRKLSVEGKYCLKNDSESLQMEPIEKTQIKMFETRQKIFEIQSQFNTTVVKLRDEKFQLVEKIKNLLKRYHKIAKIIPDDSRIEIPVPIPSINEDEENPEAILNKCKNSDQPISTNLKKNKEPLDILKNNEIKIKEEIERKLEQGDESLSDEIRKDYIYKLLVEQNILIEDMKSSVYTWEEHLKDLIGKREEIIVKSQHLKIYLLELSQELVIRESFQPQETNLASDIRNKQNKLKDILEKNEGYVQEIKNHKIEMKRMQDQCENFDRLHKTLVSGIKHATFLRKVFKFKKSSVANDNTNNEIKQVSADKSSESEDEDALSVPEPDSCPLGCDPQRFEQSVELRGLREEHKSKIASLEKEILKNQEQIQINTEAAKTTTEELKQIQNELKKLLMDKRKQINDIDIVVVLSAKQCNMDAFLEICNAAGEHRTPDVLILESDTIKQLEDTVIRLNQETDDLNKKHQVDKKILKDMRKECKRMREEVQCLEMECRKVLSQKLTPEVVEHLGKNDAADATKILDMVLEKMAKELRNSTTNTDSKHMAEELACLKEKEKDLQQKYCDALQEYTKKLELAKNLQFELNVIKNVEDRSQNLSHRYRSVNEYKKDIDRLKRIKLKQQQQIEDLHYQIQRLKLKPSIPDATTDQSDSVYKTTLPPSAVDSPIPSTSSQYQDTKSLINALVANIKQSDIQVCENSDIHGLILNSFAKMFPRLIKGQITIQEAASEILQHVPSTSNSEINEYRRYSIESILGEITFKNVEIGEFEDFVPSVMVEKKHEYGPLVAQVIKGLLEGDINDSNTTVIDSVVEALIYMVPSICTRRIKKEDIFDHFQDFKGFDQEENKVKAMITAVLESFAQRGDYTDESEDRNSPTLTSTKSAPPKIKSDQSKATRNQTS